MPEQRENKGRAIPADRAQDVARLACVSVEAFHQREVAGTDCAHERMSASKFIRAKSGIAISGLLLQKPSATVGLLPPIGKDSVRGSRRLR